MNDYIFGGFFIYGFIRIVNDLFIEKPPIDYTGKHRYYINEEKSLIHPLTKSYQVLDIDKSTPLSPKVISKAIYHQLEYSTESRVLGYKRKYSIKDYQAAKMYLLDYYDYVTFLN
jgi:hypothetical protein